MAKERIRQEVHASFGPDDITRRTEQGWRLVAVEWERELPKGETTDKADEVPFGLQIAKDAQRLEENPSEQEVLRLDDGVDRAGWSVLGDCRGVEPARLSYSPGHAVDAGVGLPDAAASDRSWPQDFRQPPMAGAARTTGAHDETKLNLDCAPEVFLRTTVEHPKGRIMPCIRARLQSCRTPTFGVAEPASAGVRLRSTTEADPSSA